MESAKLKKSFHYTEKFYIFYRKIFSMMNIIKREKNLEKTRPFVGKNIIKKTTKVFETFVVFV